MEKIKSAWKKYISMDGSGILIALVVFAIFVQVSAKYINPEATGSFLSLANIVNIFRQQTYVGIIACGMTFVIITGNIDLSVGNQLTLLTVLCAIITWVNPVLAVVATILIGALFGLVNGLLISGLKLNSFITTLGMSSIFGSLAIIANGVGRGRSESALFSFIGSGSVLGVIPVPVIIMLVIVLIFAFVLKRTVFGQRIYAIGANPVAARYSGIRSRVSVCLSYVLSGICCGIAAVVLIARSVSSNPQAATGKEMDVILAVVLGGTSVMGGRGSILGTVIGFIFIGFLSAGFTFLGLSTYTRWIVEGIILVIALAFDVYKEKGGKLWKSKKEA